MLPSAGRAAIALSLCLLAGGKSVRAQTSEPLKPYIVLIVDVSGSMGDATGSGPPSCGGQDTRLDHAKCAITNISNAYGDIVLALARFRQTSSDTNCGDGCAITGIDCDACVEGTAGPSYSAACTNTMRSEDRFELLVPLEDTTVRRDQIVEWNNQICGTCTDDNSLATELLSAGYTPLAGSLSGAKRYWQGNDPDFATGTGSDPIVEDSPLNTYFLNTDDDPALDEQCRPYITILLTDGAETCAHFDYTKLAAASLLTTDVTIAIGDTRTYRVQTKPIGFGITAGDAEIEGIAHAGGATTRATAALDITGAIANNQTVTIGTKVYRWRTSGAGLAAANDVLIAGTVQASIDNLVAAINDTGVEGTNYGTGTVAHTQVSAVRTDADTMTVTSIIAGSSGNSIATTETMTNGAWGGATLAGGVPTTATAALDVTSNTFTNNNTVVIGGKTYRWRTTGNALAAATLTQVDVRVAGTVSVSLDNLVFAVNDAGGVEGTDYSTGTTAHNIVSAAKTDADTVTFSARWFGPSGNSITVSETMTNGAFAGGVTTLTGAVDPPGDQGFYATDENTLSIALANIIEDSLRFEKCNGIDDDCDGQIDEDFKAPLLSPGLGDSCNDGEIGACRDTGTFICSTDQLGVSCTAADDEVNPPQSAEVCNFADDDCDNKIDEAPASCAGCLPVETCNGRDDDCDGTCDEDLTRVCGSDVGDCELGTQDCIEEADLNGDRICDNTADWGPCDDVGPEAEDCNGEDDDCDGTVDGFTEDCTSMPDPPGNPNVGICHPGQRTCPSDGSGWTPCTGEVVPDPLDPNDVSCDGLDNNCNDDIDEGFTPSNCSSACGTGMTECTPSGIVCEDTQTPEPEVCDGFDNDCNGLVDDNITEPPTGEPCDDNGTLCQPGVWVCNASTGGEFECQGGVPPGMEICNCIDDNCNDMVDDGAICPPGQSCVNSGSFCQCAPPCMSGEFQCFAGRHCVEGFCLLDPCYMVDCPPVGGEEQACIDDGDDGDPDCVSACDPRVTMCPAPTVCRPADGECVFDDCRGFPERCEADELCVGGTCVSDPCTGVTCTGAGEYCVGGNCVASCSDVDCPDGQVCVLGECEVDPCGGPCPSGEVCEDSSGQCVDDPCQGQFCPQGEWCNPQTGDCEQDPCLGVECPNEGDECEGGTCFDPDDFQPDAGPDDHDYVAPGGGGGCSTSGGGASLVLLLGLVLLIVRRRGGVR